MDCAAELPKILNEYVQGSEHPDLQVYRRDVVDGDFLNVWLWRTKHYCDLGNFYKESVSWKSAAVLGGTPSGLR